MDDHQDPAYTIGELAEAAETTPRTIRYYTAEGLLPPPDTRGRYAVYNDEHLQRLRAIARLKEAYLPLQEIKARLDEMTPAHIVEFLHTPTSLSSASAYVEQILARHGRARETRLGEQGDTYHVQDSAPAAKQSAPPSANLMHAVSDERWRRIPLVSGVELHVREPLTATMETRLQRAVALAREALRGATGESSEGGPA